MVTKNVTTYFVASLAESTDCDWPENQSAKSGNWSDPNTWTRLQVPGANDKVQINNGDIVNVDVTVVAVKSLCNFGTLVSNPGVNIQIAASDFIYNSGTIRGSDGRGYAGAGSDIVLGAGKAVYNAGTLQGGNGGNDGSYGAVGGDGGSVGITAEKVTNEGTIISGNGGYGHSGWAGGSGQGGDGGGAVLTATSVLMNLPGGKITTGSGGSGWAVPYVACRSKHRFGPFRWGHTCTYYSSGGWYAAGVRGDITYSALTTVQNGALSARKITIDPNTLEITSATALIEADEDIIITGGEESTVYIADLINGAIKAGGKITIMLGPGSTLDMRGLPAGAIQAKETVEIFADNIVMDENVTIEQLIVAPEITQNPGKEPHEVILTGNKHFTGEAGATVKMDFSVINHSAKSDTFTITLSDTKGGQRTAVSSPVSLAALGKQDFSFNVTLPSEAGAEDVITITSASLAYPEAKATLEVKIGVEMVLTENDLTDEDEDGLPKFQEVKLGTDPANKDTDGDGMDDGWEVHYKLNPLANDAGEDKDSDGYSNLQEYESGSDPTVADSDGDGINDGNDNCIDVKNPDQANSDGDETGDACEMSETDSDNDAMLDEWEEYYNLDISVNDAAQDKDGDGWTNFQEFQSQTNPNDANSRPGGVPNPDSDGDGVADAEDVFPDDPTEWADWDGDTFGDNRDEDDDNDRMSDTWEKQYGLDFHVSDATFCHCHHLHRDCRRK